MGKFLFLNTENRNIQTLPRYLASDHLGRSLETQCIHQIFADFMSGKLAENNKIFVFSCEGWGGDFQNSLIAKCTCEDKKFRVLVFQNIRPQIDILIPAYLQWILWQKDNSLGDCYKHLKEAYDWNRQVEAAYRLGANEVFTRFSRDIVGNFCSLLNINYGEIERPLITNVNKSLPIEAITFLMRNRELRPGPHTGGIDFIIEEIISEFSISTEPVRLSVPEDLVKEIVDYFNLGNLEIIGTLSEDQRVAFIEKSLIARNELIVGEHNLDASNVDLEFLEKLAVGTLTKLKQSPSRENSAIQERDSAIQERDTIMNSRIWRISKTYRNLRNKFK